METPKSPYIGEVIEINSEDKWVKVFINTTDQGCKRIALSKENLEGIGVAKDVLLFVVPGGDKVQL